MADAALIDVTRPESGRFRIRVYIEALTPPAADVVLARVASALESTTASR